MGPAKKTKSQPLKVNNLECTGENIGSSSGEIRSFFIEHAHFADNMSHSKKLAIRLILRIKLTGIQHLQSPK